MSHVAVLIVGAGPSGLMMASELARHGIAFRLIDKKPERTLTSNAAAIQTRTVEVFDQIGVLPSFIRNGLICKAINIYPDKNKPLHISLDNLDSAFPFMLMMPQADTERLLNAHLETFQHHVERPVEFLSMRELPNQLETRIKLASGEEETLTCDWLIACDGSRSQLREQCGMSFSGEDINEQFMVADAHMNSFVRHDEIHIFNSSGTAFAVFPIADNRYRLAANLHVSHPREFFTEKEVKEVVIERGRGEFNVDSVAWISPFWIHSKIINNFRHQRIFFVGDAAHIHSPMGGQGMNTGLQDAYNLAWKLALVINHHASNRLLDSYHAERYPVVKAIVDNTERMTRLMISENKLINWVRNTAFTVLRHLPKILNRIITRMTQLSIAYRNSPIVEAGTLSWSAPKPGERAPDVTLQSSKRLHDYFRNTKHNVLIFAGKSPTAATKEACLQLQKIITENHALLATPWLVINDPTMIANHTIYDVDNHIHNKYAVTQACVCIIRPDQYIGMCCRKIDAAKVSAYFEMLAAK